MTGNKDRRGASPFHTVLIEASLVIAPSMRPLPLPLHIRPGLLPLCRCGLSPAALPFPFPSCAREVEASSVPLLAKGIACPVPGCLGFPTGGDPTLCIATYLDFIPLLNLPAVLLNDLLVFVSQVIQYLCQVFAGGSIDLHAHVATSLRLQLPHFLQRVRREKQSAQVISCVGDSGQSGIKVQGNTSHVT